MQATACSQPFSIITATNVFALDPPPAQPVRDAVGQPIHLAVAQHALAHQQRRRFRLPRGPVGERIVQQLQVFARRGRRCPLCLDPLHLRLGREHQLRQRRVRMRDHLLGEQCQMLGQLLDEATGELGGLVLQPHVHPVALGECEEQQVVLAIHRLQVLRGSQCERPDRPRPGDRDVRQLDGVRRPRPAQAAITSWNDRRSCARVARRCSCTCCTNWAKVSSGVKLAVAISELTNEPIDCANGLPRRSVGYSTATISCSV